MSTSTETPIRAAVFDTVPQATRVVRKMLEAGFTTNQITVVCSEDTKLRYFREFEHQEPAGTFTSASALAGGTLGALLGGAAAIAGTIATGGVALVAAGGLAMWSGGVVGGLLGAMMTRGVEHELADHYDQAVAEGKILVAAQSEHHPEMLIKAEEIFAEEEHASRALREG